METGKRPIDQSSLNKNGKRKKNKPEELQLEVGGNRQFNTPLAMEP